MKCKICNSASENLVYFLKIKRDIVICRFCVDSIFFKTIAGVINNIDMKQENPDCNPIDDFNLENLPTIHTEATVVFKEEQSLPEIVNTNDPIAYYEKSTHYLYCITGGLFLIILVFIIGELLKRLSPIG